METGWVGEMCMGWGRGYQAKGTTSAKVVQGASVRAEWLERYQ